MSYPAEYAGLGRLVPSSQFSAALVGQLSYGTGHVDFVIDPDGEPIEDSLALAASAAGALTDLDRRCKELVAAEYLDSYNTGWRIGEVMRPDGNFERFEKPALSPAEFCEKLELKSFEATGGTLLTFWYDDDGMFWGHSLYVDSFDGALLGDTHVAMFG